MFSRGIRGILIDDNISAVVLAPSERTSALGAVRQLLSYDRLEPVALLMTPRGETVFVTKKERKNELCEAVPDALCLDGIAKLSVFGVCMNGAGAKIYRLLCNMGIAVHALSVCDIAVSLIINAADADAAVRAVRDNFILEL